jgi:hypothetical protein
MIDPPLAISGTAFCTANSVPPHVNAEDVVEIVLGHRG